MGVSLPMRAWLVRVRRLAALVLFASTLAWSPAAQGQSGPAPAKEGLHVGSPPAVLNDPIVKACRLLAARRTDPKVAPGGSAVEVAAMMFELGPVFDAVTKCRGALAAYPDEPKVIIAHYNASEALSMLVFGLSFPDLEEEAFGLALRNAAEPENASGLGGRLLGFYLGSAYEYGVGTKPDRALAMTWYTVAANAGDPISRRELARLQSGSQ
jgi:TPR repeat protein